MAYFEDLSPYTYFGDPTPESASLVRNFGWLDRSHEFPRGELPTDALDAIWDYCSILVQPTRGLHTCELCTDARNTFVRHETRRLLGSGEIRVFGPDRDAFAAPNLIYHYVRDHQYRPPPAVLRALNLARGRERRRIVRGSIGSAFRGVRTSRWPRSRARCGSYKQVTASSGKR
jgi:hypothetical protein